MTYLASRPSDFASDMLAGFVAANGRWVRPVRGGVVRSEVADFPRVAVVIGGGSGHYPAFAGLVGPGLAAGAAVGNVFASPSTAQIVSVAEAADEGAGVLFSYGNYAGDVLNFDQAEAELTARGISASTVRVTDDISSAAPDEAAKRRGVAGGLFVYKVAGAAAAAGLPLARVTEIAARANDRVRTLGVAFSGCTLPGASEPLFTVPAGRMAVGMGVHGEPGISEQDAPSADDLAGLLVDQLLGEVPGNLEPHGARIVLILNGLGSVKSEELFVLYGKVAELCAQHGLEIVDAQVGEFTTSFEMAGLSLSICWLDRELEEFWFTAASSPAFSRVGPAGLPAAVHQRELELSAETEPIVPHAASAGSHAVAEQIVRAFDRARTAIDDAVDELGRLDQVAGDGDHGIGMQRGIVAGAEAARESWERGAGAGSVLDAAGAAWADRAGGTSGAIWGVALRAVASVLGDDDTPTLHSVATAARHAQNMVQSFGKVSVGDKTMLDAIVPFVSAIESADRTGRTTLEAWHSAAQAASAAADATAALQPRTGRARAHGDKSIGSPDPGAVSFALIARAIDEALEKEPAHD